MLKLSGLAIQPNKSRDYILALIVINIVIIFLSISLEVEIKYVLILITILFLQIIKEFKNSKPHPDIDTISFNGRYWSIKSCDGLIKIYSKCKIRLDAGLLIFVTFYDAGKIKNLVIFKDQISDDQRRYIYIVAKLMR